MKRISITDIARELKVTPSTVSRALNGGPRIGEKTRQAVLDLAHEWGYRPNPLAKGLHNSKTYNIGLIIPEFTHHFFNQVLRGIESVAVEKDYHLVTCTSNNGYEKEKKSVQTLLDLRVDGFLISIGDDTEACDHFQEIIDYQVPLIFIDRICEDVEASYVITDDFQGAYQGTEHLITMGGRQIVYIKGPTHISTTFNRLMGYQEALKKWQIPYREELVIEGNTGESVDEALSVLLRSHSVDAVFAHSDYLAYEAVRTIQRAGYQIPSDILVMGYANEPISAYMTPRLSTVQQPAFDLGKTAATLLLQQMEGDATRNEVVTHYLPTSLIIRDSTSRRPR